MNKSRKFASYLLVLHLKFLFLLQKERWVFENSNLCIKSKIVTATGLEPTTTYFINEHSAIQPNWPNDELCCEYLSVHVSVCCYHVTYALHRESTLYGWRVIPHSIIHIQATIECGFTLKHVRDMIKKTLHMHPTLVPQIETVLIYFYFIKIPQRHMP